MCSNGSRRVDLHILEARDHEEASQALTNEWIACNSGVQDLYDHTTTLR